MLRREHAIAVEGGQHTREDAVLVLGLAGQAVTR
jgi:hypothetical protein